MINLMLENPISFGINFEAWAYMGPRSEECDELIVLY